MTEVPWKQRLYIYYVTSTELNWGFVYWKYIKCQTQANTWGYRGNESCSVVSDSLQHHGLYSPRNSPSQNTGVSSLSLLQGIFPTQGSNPCLLHCRGILYQLSHKGSPRIPEWVAYPFSSRSSQPRNWTGVSCIAGGFFTNWARRCIQIQSLEKLSIKWRWQICELMNSGRCNQFYRWVVEIQNMGNKFAQSGHINRCLI